MYTDLDALLSTVGLSDEVTIVRALASDLNALRNQLAIKFPQPTLTQWQNYVKWTSPKGKLQFGLTTVNNFGRLKEGAFVQRLWQLQSAYSWSPNFALTSFIRYDTDSQNLGSNTRLRWTVKPGNDIFIVWNRAWQRLLPRPSDLNLIPDQELP